MTCATLLACNDGPVEDLPVVNPTISADKVYAGATLIAHAPNLAQRADSVVWAGTLPASVIARGGDSIVFILPSTVKGRFTVSLGSDGREPLGSVEASGFVERRPVAADLGFYVDVYPEGPVASLITGNRNNDVQQFFPKTRGVKLLLHNYRLGDADTRTPGRTPDPAIVLLQPTSGNLEQWRLLPTPVNVGSFPATNPRHFALFNDSTGLLGTHHWVEIRRYRGAAIPLVLYHGIYEETHEVIISPKRDLATLRVNGSPTGPPVFDMIKADTAYHVRQLFRSYGAAFSANGDTLWMLGAVPEYDQTWQDYRTLLLQLDAHTGRELKRFTFATSIALAMRRDPGDGRIFVAAMPGGAPSDAPIELYVIDEKSFVQLGHVSAPPELTCASWCGLAVLAVGMDGVFLVEPKSWVYEFEYQP